jgi:DNA-binding transcriptional ArsR family regulator
MAYIDRAAIIFKLILKNYLDIYDYAFRLIVMRTEYLKELPEAWRDVSDVFVALGDPQRQRIVLMFEPGERLNVTQIVSASKLSRTAISHHLKVLRQAGVLSSEKTAKEVYFWIEKEKVGDVMRRVLAYINDNT